MALLWDVLANIPATRVKRVTVEVFGGGEKYGVI